MKTNLMKKVLGFVLTLVIMCSMLPMTSNAAETTKVYLKPGTNWISADARIVMYAFNDYGNQWVDFIDANGDGVYVAELSMVPTAVIFLRYNPVTKDYDEKYGWDYWHNDNKTGYVWNRTGNITWPGNTNNCYTIPDNWWGHESGETIDGVLTAWSQDAWSHEVHDFVDGTCACGVTETDTIGAKLAGYSLSVDGKIGVNFHMELDAAVVADDTAYMQFTLPDGTTPKVYVNDVEATTKTVAEKTYYVFPCEVAAKEMASTITAQMITAQGNSTEYTYTVRDYADALIARSTNDAEKAFVKAMLNYGAYAQTYFGYNTSDLANKNLSESDINNAIPENLDLSAYKATGTKAATDDYLGSYVANLLLESTTTFNIKVTPKDGVTINTINDVAEGSLTKEGNAYVVSFGEINASQLDDLCTVVVKDAASNTATLTFYPLTYCERVLATSDNVNLKNVVGALYMYNKAANDYVK